MKPGYHGAVSSDAAARRELELTSTANPRVKALSALRRRRAREQQKLTIVDGQEELLLALDAGTRPRALYYCPELVTDPEPLLTRVAALNAEIIRVNRRIFEKITYRESPDGWLAVVPAIDARLDRVQIGQNPLVLVCESVEKPGNLGAMLRTADAAGLDAVIAADPIADWGNPNIIRASKGTVFSVPVAEASSDETLAWLRRHGIQIVATTPDTDTLYYDVDMSRPTAVVVGTEKHGLTDRWLTEADQRVRIPMRGRIDSLNVATSAALVVYEAVRQRGQN